MNEFAKSPKLISIQKERLMPQEEMLEVGSKNKKFVIGVPREVDENEGRVALTPLGVELLINSGHEVMIEKNAGAIANFSDYDYSKYGAFIVDHKNEVFKADIILKVAPLVFEEIDFLTSGQLVISSLHVTFQSKEYLEKMMEKRVTAISFEYLKDQNNTYPIVRSMSEIVGSTSVLIAAEYLSNIHGGKGEMLGGITGVNPTEVVILGAGTAGESAARTAIGLGAMVRIFDNSIYKLRRIQDHLGNRISTSVLHSKVLINSLKTADVVIGAVRLIEKGPRFIVTEEMVKTLKKGSVIIDISIDQGGCFETSELTTHKNPVFIKHGVMHYCVPNTASRVARTASYAISNILSQLVIQVGESGGINQLLKNDSGVRNGVYIYRGILTNEYIGNLFGLRAKDINLLMAAF